MTSIDMGITAVGMVTDKEIIQRVLDGDTAGFELIMRRYNRRLYAGTKTKGVCHVRKYIQKNGNNLGGAAYGRSAFAGP